MRAILNTKVPAFYMLWTALFVTLIAGFIGHDVLRQTPQIIRVHSVTEKVITRTVTPSPTIAIKHEAISPKPIVRSTPAPAIVVSNAPVIPLPDGVTQSGSGYIVNCWVAQCTSLTGAGPFGTTCGRVYAATQYCS
jgi:hypothetical protein